MGESLIPEIRCLKSLFDSRRPFPSREYDALVDLVRGLQTRNLELQQACEQIRKWAEWLYSMNLGKDVDGAVRNIGCPQCGGALLHVQGKRVLTCQYCSTKSFIEGVDFIPKYRL